MRQGDPLSPFLSVLVMEFWPISMDLAMASNRVQTIKRGDKYQVSHPLFAHDMLVFCRATKKSLQTLNIMFTSLQLHRGLIINRRGRANI